MGLSIYLYQENGNEIVDNVGNLSITHNLTKMAQAVIVPVDKDTTLYSLIWRPDEHFMLDNGHVPASLVMRRLPALINSLVQDKEVLQQYNPENGWGSYDGLLKFCLDYYKALCLNPKSFVYCCR